MDSGLELALGLSVVVNQIVEQLLPFPECPNDSTCSRWAEEGDTESALCSGMKASLGTVDSSTEFEDLLVIPRERLSVIFNRDSLSEGVQFIDCQHQ